MRKYLLSIALLILSIFSANAHLINNYKYLYLIEHGNLYGIEENINEFFTGIGFKTLSSSEMEELNNIEKAFVLVANYNFQIVYGGHSTLLLELKNLRGTTVFCTSGEGISFSARGDMKNASKKIFSQIKNLNYEFTPPKDDKLEEGLDIANLSETEIKERLKYGKRNIIEGIYKNISNDGDFYRFAVLEDNGIFYGIIIESDNAKWSKGDLKMKLSHIEENIYDVEYYDYTHKKQNSVASLENRILKIVTQDYGHTTEYQYLKVFPNTTEVKKKKEISSINEENKPISTGSGIFISSNIIATNYHVVNNANKVEVVLRTDGIPTNYNAKVLCCDKTNDLALIIVQDEKFTNTKIPPYSIARNLSDVGTSVFTMGFPLSNILGDEVKITDGIVSSKSGYQGDIVTYQISAAIQPGNSGGALFDKKGNLIGITNAGIPTAENVGYAIKSSYLLNLIDNAPIEIKIPVSESTSAKDLPAIIKDYTPFIACIQVF